MLRTPDFLARIWRPNVRLRALVGGQLGAGDELIGVISGTTGRRPGLDFSLLGWLNTLGLRERRRWFAIAILRDGFKVWELDRRDRPGLLVASGRLALVGELSRATEYYVEIAAVRYWIPGVWVKGARRVLADVAGGSDEA
jgi:hypothetical protein